MSHLLRFFVHTCVLYTVAGALAGPIRLLESIYYLADLESWYRPARQNPPAEIGLQLYAGALIVAFTYYLALYFLGRTDWMMRLIGTGEVVVRGHRRVIEDFIGSAQIAGDRQQFLDRAASLDSRSLRLDISLAAVFDAESIIFGVADSGLMASACGVTAFGRIAGTTVAIGSAESVMRLQLMSQSQTVASMQV